VDQLFPNLVLKEEIQEWKSAKATTTNSSVATSTSTQPPPRPQASQALPLYLRPTPPDPERPWVELHMEQEEYDRVLCMFMTFDTDSSGQLDRGELRRLCKYMNYPHREQDVAAMFLAMDTDHSGSLSFDEFVRYMQDRRPKPEILYGLSNEQYQQIMMLFHSVDDNNDGIQYVVM
jgi:hypothetical protein